MKRDFIEEIINHFYVIGSKYDQIRIFEGEIDKNNNKLTFNPPNNSLIRTLENELRASDFKRSDTFYLTTKQDREPWKGELTVERREKTFEPIRTSLYRARPYINNMYDFPMVSLEDLSNYLNNKSIIPISYCEDPSRLPPSYKDTIQTEINNKIDNDPNSILNREDVEKLSLL